MKYYGVFALFILALLVLSQPVHAATVYNRISSSRSVHNSHPSHSTSEVKTCKPSQEKDVLNRNNASKMFITQARRNTRFSKSSNTICKKPLTTLIPYLYVSSNINRHLNVLSTLIFFPFHAFW